MPSRGLKPQSAGVVVGHNGRPPRQRLRPLVREAPRTNTPAIGWWRIVLATKKVRVHNLAKELLVDSKVIIEKCRDEGIDVKNHMHVVSAGLAATIREWFSEGAHSTTLEESRPVDLRRVRKESTAKKSKQKAKTSTESSADTAVQVLEATEDEAAGHGAKKVVPKRKAPKEAAAHRDGGETGPETGVAAPAATPAEVAGGGEAAAVPVAPAALIEAPRAPGESSPVEGAPPSKPLLPAASADATAEGAPPPTVVADAEAVAGPAGSLDEAAAPPQEPSVVVAGPQNIPKPAQLTGPKLIRYEKPDEDAGPPRHAGRTGGGARPREGERFGTRLRVDEPRREDEDDRGGRRGAKGRTPSVVPEKRAHPRRTTREVNTDVTERIREWRDRDLIERRDRLAQASGRGIGGLRAIEGKQTARRGAARTTTTPIKKDKVEITAPILVKDFSRETGIAVNAVVKKLMQEHGTLATINSALDPEIAQMFAMEYGIELRVLPAKTSLDLLVDAFAARERTHLVTRSPVVTVLGHVDHGKTSLLDRIREANVTAGEAGGITQHIGAYRVEVGDRFVTFIDTPGHTAFTAMRARGTKLTDVVVLVVAADDGVMPTTVEAINHARAAGTPIVVALNKIDLPHDINKLYGDLSEHGLTPSGDWGGQTDVIKTSAVTGEGIDELLTHLAMLSEVMDLKADPTLPASGVVVEAHRSGTLGNVARVIVQEGTLRTSDIVLCGASYGRVRSLRDDKGSPVEDATPSMPVEIWGLNDVPMSGDKFYVVENMQRAKDIADDVAARLREQDLLRVAKPTSLESVLANASEGEIPELRVIIRADVRGSVDVLRKTLSEFPANEVKLVVLHAGVGNVTESDVVLAQASSAIVVAFHVAPDPQIRRMADDLGVDIRAYRVIYNLLDDIRSALEGLLTPDEKLESRGRAEVREVFNISRIGKIAGCYVRDGVVERGHTVRVIRDGVVVKDSGTLESLRRFKDDVKEVKAGMECGIRITGFDDLKPADVIETFELLKIARKLET